MDPSTRLGEFIDWAGVGLDESRLCEFRRFGEEIVGKAGGERVTAEHIQAVVAAHSGEGKAIKHLIEEVGDAFLRFEQAKRGSARPMATGHGPLKPPVRPSKVQPTEGPPPVTFAHQGDAVPVPSDNEGSGRTQGAQFRCPKCKVFVSPTSKGSCPTCDTLPPHLLNLTGIPTSSEARTQEAGLTPNATRLARAGLWLGSIAAAILLAVHAVDLGHRWIDQIQHPSETLLGDRSLDALGVVAFFPREWRREKESDFMHAHGELAYHGMQFFRGGTSRSPSVRLLVMNADTGGALDESMTDAQFEKVVAEQSPIGPQRLPRGLDGVIHGCEVVTLPVRRTARCAGTAFLGSKEATLVKYHWLTGRRLWTTVLVSNTPVYRTVAEGDEIVSSLEPPRTDVPSSTPAPPVTAVAPTP
ncbi:MAG: hypothetical protein HY698_03715 [Deltaproteobacteria bacterium]|nr:hypothetical protein [Deltaproteobacteria bacterium]